MKYDPFTKLLEIRKAVGLTREELSIKSGVKPETISALETGVNNYKDAKISTLLAICKGLGCKLIHLFPNEKNIA